MKATGNCVPTVSELREILAFTDVSKEDKATADKLQMIDATDLEIYGEALLGDSQKSHENQNQRIQNTFIAKEKSLLFILTAEGSLMVSILDSIFDLYIY